MKRIHAKSCIIKRIEDKAEVKRFLNINHTQRYCNYITAYGLYYENELVQILTFGKPRFNKWYSWELLRDCTRKDYMVYEGVSTLWNKFIEENIVRNCICYSYPHDVNNLYTNKYVDYCGFKNVFKAKPTKKIYFEGVWNGGLKRIDKSILERHGVDRLLKGSFGQDRTNEQILLGLGFEKKYEDGCEPQVDSFFPKGIVYKITDLNNGKFYIGETFKVDEFKEEKYNGSGGEWIKYYEKYKHKHSFKREILKEDFKTPKELYEYEIKEIEKYCIKLKNGKCQVDKTTGCMNTKTTLQPKMPICPECNSILFHHKKTCSQYKDIEPCSECGKKYGHKKNCSMYIEGSSCLECGGKNGQHYRNCSKYKTRICSECGCNSGHLKTCSKNNKKRCPECGSLTIHKLNCSKYKEPKRCLECGNINSHKRTCSKYRTRNIICEECGIKDGKHKDSCSKSKGKCPECGYSLQSHRHSPNCSKYKKPKSAKICKECGSSMRSHKKSCSKFKEREACSECEGKAGNHKKLCSKYKRSQ